VRIWLILFVLCALMEAYGQRVEVPVQSYTSTGPAIELASIRAMVADPTWARIAKAKVILQKRERDSFRDTAWLETDQEGNFDFGKRSPGIYRLSVSARGFCEATILIKVSAKGQPGIKIALPIGVSDTPSGYCDKKLVIEQMKK